MSGSLNWVTRWSVQTMRKTVFINQITKSWVRKHRIKLANVNVCQHTTKAAAKENATSKGPGVKGMEEYPHILAKV